MTGPFPPDFWWGAATSAFQIEGSLGADGRGASVWDVFARRPGVIADGSDAATACDSYRRWRDDLDLIERLHLNAYRFSVGWSRVMPEGPRPGRSGVEPRALDHYERFVDGLLDRGVTPLLTLNHWDMPQALMSGPDGSTGGWAARSSVDAFAAYADAVAVRLADRVQWWVTHNEPWIVSVLGYQLGLHAPGVRDLHASAAASHHLLLGHGAAADLLHTYPGARVGCALSLFPCDPASGSAADAAAAAGSDGYVNRWYLDALLGPGYPADMREHWERALGSPLDVIRDGDEEAIRDRSDYVGVNFYTRRLMAAAAPAPPEQPFGWRVVDPGEVPRTDAGWEICPDHLRDLLIRLNQEYPGTPIVVTENGGVFNDPPAPDGQVRDERRIVFIREHVTAMAQAVAAGVDLRGYFHWSLLDNFEWAMGYPPRFGLTHVDASTGRRSVKASATFYAELARTGTLPAL